MEIHIITWAEIIKHPSPTFKARSFSWCFCLMEKLIHHSDCLSILLDFCLPVCHWESVFTIIRSIHYNICFQCSILWKKINPCCGFVFIFIKRRTHIHWDFVNLIIHSRSQEKKKVPTWELQIGILITILTTVNIPALMLLRRNKIHACVVQSLLFIFPRESRF